MRTIPAQQIGGTGPAVRRAVAAAPPGRVHPLLVVTFLFFLPPISWYAGPVYMTPMRLLYLFTVPVLLVIWARGGMGPRLAVDWLLIGFCAWVGLTVGLNNPSQTASYAASNALTVFGGYFTARYTVRSAADFMAVSRFLVGLVIIVLLPMGLYEALLIKDPIVTQLLAHVDGITTHRVSDYCCRLGLNRAQSVFEHPIHHGVICALPFALYIMGRANHESLIKRSIVGGLLLVASLTSVSSGAILSMALMGALIAYAILLEKHPAQWKIFMWVVLIGYVALEIRTTKFAFFTLSERLAFNSWNVHVRGMIYDAGIAQIKQTPLFGFGFRRLEQLPHWLTGSVDNHWVLLAIRHGLPGFLLPFAALLYAIARAGRNGFTKGSDLYNVKLGYQFTLVAMIFCLATVAAWAELETIVFMILGMGMFLFSARETPAEDAVQTVPRAGPVYTRFPGGRAGAPVAACARPFVRASKTGVSGDEDDDRAAQRPIGGGLRFARASGSVARGPAST